MKILKTRPRKGHWNTAKYGLKAHQHEIENYNLRHNKNSTNTTTNSTYQLLRISL